MMLLSYGALHDPQPGAQAIGMLLLGDLHTDGRGPELPIISDAR